MSILGSLYEVRVRVKSNGARHYWSSIGMWIRAETIMMFHVDARTSKHAAQICEKHGTPVNVRKVSDRINQNLEKLPLLQEHMETPYESAVAMDEMIWKKKKRKNRILMQKKDKRC